MDALFYKNNRQELYKQLPEAAVLAVCSGESVHRTADDYFRFFANRNFVYLTGIDDPDCTLVAYRLHGEIHETLYIRDMDPVKEHWTGRRIRIEEAKDKSGITDIRYSSLFNQEFHRIAGNCYFKELQLVLEVNTRQELTDQNRLFYRAALEKYPNLTIKNIFPQLAYQRSHKSSSELDNLIKALEITREGILQMMKSARTAESEMELFGEFMHVLHRHGIIEPAFKPIIACGKNNFFLHYDTPMGSLSDGDLCLADVGAIVDYCCVDISRVFPRNGRFSKQQKEIYQICLEVNNYITDYIKPGMPFTVIEKLCREKAFEGLKTVGLLNDFADIGKYVWHGCTHHVGFDVHDAGTYHHPIEENMVFTMDTGIYIKEWNLGMRIEDNVLVTSSGLKRLSGNIPRTIEDIEAAMV